MSDYPLVPLELDPDYLRVYPALLCDFCGKTDTDVTVYRQNTAYVELTQNYVAACPTCKMMNDEYWDSMWAEYYSSVR